MEIALIIKPTNSLTPEQFAKIRERADADGITPEEFVANAIQIKLDQPAPQLQPAA